MTKWRGCIVSSVMFLLLVISVFGGLISTGKNISRDHLKIKNLTNGLVAYWDFEEGSGNILHDVSGHGNDGTIYGAQWVDGVEGNALSFYRSEGDYVKIPSSESLKSISESFTLTAWVYLKSYPESGYHGEVLLMMERPSNGYEGSENGLIWYISERDSYEEYAIAFNYGGDYDKDFKTTYVIPLNQWHFVAVKGDSQGNLKIYVDDSVVASGEWTPPFPLDNLENTWIGLDIDGDTDKTDFLDGIVDELRIYNRALSDEEIKELYYEVAPKAPQNLQVEKGRGWINLMWDPPENKDSVEIEKYEIYRSEDGINYEKIGETSQLNYNDTLVKEGKAYYYYVVANTASGVVGDKSEEVSVTLIFPPLPPENVNIKFVGGYVELSWDSPSDNGGKDIEKYIIYRSTDGKNYVKIGEVSADIYIYEDRNVVPGTTYYYYVTAVNSVGESARSQIVKVTTPVEFPWLWVFIGIIIAVVIVTTILTILIKKKSTPLQLQNYQQQPPQTNQ